MKDIMELNVYTEALDFSNQIWTFCKQFDYFAQQTVGIQLVKSADSFSANIAEGFGRYHFKENLNFCYFARGSVEETKDWLRKAFQRKLISSKLADEINSEIIIIAKQLNNYINSIKSRASIKK
ncbi:MAG: four helix bundle protein [Candidatus Cloacimonetes bacterium]|nr:four helix bundle protein [Candidatus Cloacimonadota bacterium]